MASDLRRLRASVAHGARPGRWAMFGTFAAGLVVALVGAAFIEYMGARPHATLWLNFDGLRLIGAWVFSVAAIGAGATWFSTRC
jgi:hypothetical protein